MNILFVGGPLDGQRNPLPSGCGQYYKCYTRDGVSNNGPEGPQDFGVKIHTYLMQAIGKERVMMHDSVQSIFEALIKGYKRHRKPGRWSKAYR